MLKQMPQLQGVPFGLIKERYKDPITSSNWGLPTPVATGDGGIWSFPFLSTRICFCCQGLEQSRGRFLSKFLEKKRNVNPEFSLSLSFFFFFFFFVFLGPHHLQHMEVPRLGVKSFLPSQVFQGIFPNCPLLSCKMQAKRM